MRSNQLLRKRKDTNSIWSDIAEDDLVDSNKGVRRGLSRFSFGVAILVATSIFAYFAWGMLQINNREPNAVEVASKAKGSVVGLECDVPSKEMVSAGSGVAIEVPTSGIYKTAILSAAHIFDDCKIGSDVNVIHEGVTYVGVLENKDPIAGNGEIETYETDLALIYVEADIPKLKPGKAAQIGDWAIVIGNPLDITNYVTVGVISSVTDSEYSTDAAANHGNSGGPLLNSKGQVIGIVSSGAIEENAIDSNEKGIWDHAAGITSVKRLKLACSQIFQGSDPCPFSD